MRKILLSILASIYRYRLLQPQQVWHKHRAWGLGLVALGLAVVCGLSSTRWIDKPCLRLGERPPHLLSYSPFANVHSIRLYL